MIRAELLTRFKELYHQKYGVLLTDEQATEYAISFLTLMKVLTKPNKQLAE